MKELKQFKVKRQLFFKKGVLKNLQNSQESIYARISF